MEIFDDVWMKNRESGIKNKANEAIYTFVAVKREDQFSSIIA